MESIPVEDMAEESHFGLNKAALRFLKLQSMLSDDIEDFQKVLHMFLDRSREYHNVIDVHPHEILMAKELVHHSVKGGRGIHQTERHFFELKSSETKNEGRHLLAFF